MRKCAALLLLLLMAVPPLRGQSAAPVTLVKAARLLDPRTGNVLAPAAVLIEGDKVKQVGPSARLTAPAGSKIIDLGAATLLPGLIDSHTHLFLDIIVPPELEQQRHYNGLFAPGMVLAIIESPSKRVLMGAQLAREDLDIGITTVRNLGHSGVDGDTELRDAINACRVPGPRILASGRKLITRGSYVQNFLLIDEQVEQMRDKGIFLDMTPTFDDFFYLKVTEPSIVISPASSADAVSRNRRRKQQLRFCPDVVDQLCCFRAEPCPPDRRSKSCRRHAAEGHLLCHAKAWAGSAAAASDQSRSEIVGSGSGAACGDRNPHAHAGSARLWGKRNALGETH
jgi:hypothetical protein